MPHDTYPGEPGLVAELDQLHARVLHLLRGARNFWVVAVQENGRVESGGCSGDDRDDDLRLALALLNAAKHVTGWEWEKLASLLGTFAQDEDEEAE